MKKQHIWCNLHNPHHPVSDAEIDACPMCRGLNEDHPQGELTEEELAVLYFPGAIPIK